MNGVIVKDENIENLIYEIRRVQVMLDSDLARLYECTNGTKDINKAVKRNIDRFPKSFVFQLTDNEYHSLRFQIGTSKIKGGRRYNPYVFTEQGVAMLSSVLHSEVAIKMSIQIINAFVSLRKYVSSSLIEQKYINNLVLDDHNRINTLEASFEKFEEKRKDNLLTHQDIDRYNKQYHNLKVVFNNTFHDRYFIIDNKVIYHCGTSVNKIGYKTFSITKMGDKEVCDLLIEKVNMIKGEVL